MLIHPPAAAFHLANHPEAVRNMKNAALRQECHTQSSCASSTPPASTPSATAPVSAAATPCPLSTTAYDAKKMPTGSTEASKNTGNSFQECLASLRPGRQWRPCAGSAALPGPSTTNCAASIDTSTRHRAWQVAAPLVGTPSRLREEAQPSPASRNGAATAPELRLWMALRAEDSAQRGRQQGQVGHGTPPPTTHSRHETHSSPSPL